MHPEGRTSGRSPTCCHTEPNGRKQVNADAAYSPTYSEPFVEEELIAVRDEPAGPIYVARIMYVDPKEITVHYYGCTEIALANATFKPCLLAYVDDHGNSALS